MLVKSSLATAGDVRGDPQQPVVYLLGNSLGLKPRRADLYMREQLDNWGQQAAFMHFNGRVPAALADQPGKEITADIVGARDLAERRPRLVRVREQLLRVLVREGLLEEVPRKCLGSV